MFKYELSFLLYTLKKKGYFRPVGSKGYFSIAERHITDYSGKSLKKNTLKKCCSKICKNPDKYIDIIRRVDKMLKNITNNGEGLLRDYSK